MDGVIILDTLKVVESNDSGNIILFAFGTILICIGFWVLYYTLSKISQFGFKLIAFTILAGLLVVTGFIMCVPNSSGYEKTQYQVLLTEDANIVEFKEKYEIIREQGITYIVEERNSQEENVNE